MDGVLAGKTVTRVIGGRGAQTSDGAIYTWGYNFWGQLGAGSPVYESRVPVAVDMTGVLAGKTVTHAIGTGDHTAVLTSDGSVHGWGYNVPYYLGNRTDVNAYSPVSTIMPELTSIAFDGIPGTDLSALAGGLASVLTPAHPSGVVDVAVTTGGNDGYPQNTTVVADGFTYGLAPQVVTNPQSVTTESGDPVSFSASASGDEEPAVRWQVSTDGGATWNDIADETGSTLTVVAREDVDGNEYRAVFSNGLGSATTDPARLTLTAVSPSPTPSSSGTSSTPAPGGASSTPSPSGAAADPTTTLSRPVPPGGGLPVTGASGWQASAVAGAVLGALGLLALGWRRRHGDRP